MKTQSTHEKIKQYLPTFKNQIKKINIKDIELNKFNPRKKFGQEEEDELIESINSKGILQPIIVYKKNEKYVVLDGQRRFQSCKKLGIKEIPAHILMKAPDFLDNLSIMFHIHNVHEDWTDVAITVSLEEIIRELNINRNRISGDDINEIQRITSLSKYKINKYLRVLRFSKSIINRFLEAELKEKPDLDIDLLSELVTPIKKLRKIMPKITNKYSDEDIVDVFIQKKKDKIITTNKQIRMITKIASNVAKGKVNKELAIDKITAFFKNKDLTIEEIYSDTSEAVEQAKGIIKMCEKLIKDILNIDLRKVPLEDKTKLNEMLIDLMDSIKRKAKV